MRRTTAAALITSLVIVGAIAVVLLLVDSSGDDAGGGSTEEATAFVAFVRDDDLWVAPLGAAAPPRRITPDGPRFVYAGHVLRLDGGVDLYYASEASETDAGGARGLSLYRIGAEGGLPEELLRLPGLVADFFVFPSPGASVSPSGEHLLYTSKDGLTLFDLRSGQAERLLSASCSPTVRVCGKYLAPRWSPKGDVATVMKAFLESMSLTLVRPFESPVRVIDTEHSLQRAGWSPNGERLCLSQGQGVTGAKVVVYDVETNEVTDILASLGLPTPRPGGPPNAYGCAWSQSGQLAVGYTPDFTDTSGRIAILDDDRRSIVVESDPIEHLAAVTAWLPDGSGVVVARRDPDGGSFSVGIFRPGTDTEYLPFEADRVLAVIP